MSARHNGPVPTPTQAAALAAGLLGDVGTKLAHVLRAGSIASQLTVLFDDREAALLVAAATLHDIGYSPRIARTGFHPLDGGIYLASRGLNLRLAGLVANHSLAYINAPAHGIHNLEDMFPRETGLLADALMFADMHSAPNGAWVRGADRISEIAGRHTYPGTSHRLELVGQALARVAAAAKSAGLPDLDLGPAPEPPARLDDIGVNGLPAHGGHGVLIARGGGHSVRAGTHFIPEQGRGATRTGTSPSGSAARLRVAASRHAGGPPTSVLGRN
jgi:hypothetical protein